MGFATKPETRGRVAAFGVVFVCLWVLHWGSGIAWYPADAGYYWSLSIGDPAAAMTPLRGYIYPALLRPLRLLGDASGHSFLVFQLISSGVYAWLLTGPVADLFSRVFGGKPGLVRRAIIALAPAALFPGVFLYPLSDLPALAFVLIATLAAHAMTQRRWWLAAMWAGAAMSAAYNIRTIYLFAFLAMYPLIAFHFMKGQAIARRIAAVCLFTVGALAVAIPQMIFNQARGGAPVPWLEVSVGGGSSLMAAQLFWGVSTQRYETSIRGKDYAYGHFYRDAAGVAIRSAEGARFATRSVKDYADVAIRHPLAFLGIAARHVVNGLDVRDGMVYEKRSPERRDWMSLVCATLIFACGLVGFSSQLRSRAFVPLLPVMLPVAAITLGAVETRFFLPVYVVLMGMAVMRFDRRVFMRFTCDHRWSVLTFYVVWTAAFVAITTSTMAESMLVLP